MIKDMLRYMIYDLVSCTKMHSLMFLDGLIKIDTLSLPHSLGSHLLQVDSQEAIFHEFFHGKIDVFDTIFTAVVVSSVPRPRLVLMATSSRPTDVLAKVEGDEVIGEYH